MAGITDISPLSGLTSLSTLEIQLNVIVDLSPLVNLRSLRHSMFQRPTPPISGTRKISLANGRN